MMHTGASANKGTIKMNSGLVISPTGMAKMDRLDRMKITVSGRRAARRNSLIIIKAYGLEKFLTSLPICPLPTAVHNSQAAKMIPKVNSFPVKKSTSSRNRTIWLIMAENPMAIKTAVRWEDFNLDIIIRF